MGLLERACETYDAMQMRYAGLDEEGREVLAPISHSVTRADIEIVIDEDGRFSMARALGKHGPDKREPKIVYPVTESSAGRTVAPVAHPLCDNLGYLTDLDPKKHALYMAQLEDWAASPFSHPKVRAVLRYLRGGTLVGDLTRAGLLVMDGGKLKNEKDFVRWKVLSPDAQGDEQSACWRDRTLMDAYIGYYDCQKRAGRIDLCMISGERLPVAQQHIKGVIAKNGNAKLISANDKDGFTYRGRFLNDAQALCVSYEASQKAHNALRWLAANDGVILGNRTFICWNPQGKPLPAVHKPLCRNTTGGTVTPTAYRKALQSELLGYKVRFAPDQKAVIAAFDAATTGRLAMTYYSEMPAADFLERLAYWDDTCCFFNGPYGVESPSLIDLVRYAFGTLRGRDRMECDDRVLGQQMQRLIACRVNKAHMPADIVRALAQKAGTLALYDRGLRGSLLCAACATTRKYRNEEFKEEWTLALERDRADRSYQFGRLLAVLEKAERDTYDRDEQREPNAIRLQPMLIRQPFQTFKVVQEALKKAYYPRLKPHQRAFYEREIESILHILSDGPDWIEQRNRPLEDTYLMGYYLEKEALYQGITEHKEENRHEHA